MRWEWEQAVRGQLVHAVPRDGKELPQTQLDGKERHKGCVIYRNDGPNIHSLCGFLSQVPQYGCKGCEYVGDIHSVAIFMYFVIK